MAAAAEIIDSKQCPRCRKVYTYLKFKYNAGNLIGGNIAAISLFFFTLLITFIKPYVGFVLAVACFTIYREASKVKEVEEKSYYWYCYKCNIDFHDKNLSGKTLYRSKRPSRSALITQSVKDKIGQDAKKKKSPMDE